MIDTHCHLNMEPLRSDSHGIFSRADSAGVEEVIIVGTDLETSDIAVRLAFELGQTAAVGVHPHEAMKLLANEQTKKEQLNLIWNELKHLSDAQCIRAIGECGLDYSQVHSATAEGKREVQSQRVLFALQLELALERNLPVIIHCRDQKNQRAAYDDALTLLEQFHSDGKPVRFVLHCVSGPLDYINRCVALGGMVSFAGNVTYPSAHSIREILHVTPLERMLTETDAPFLAPQSRRGQTNEPGYMQETVAFMAKELGMSFDELDQLTTANARKFFSL